MAWRNVWRNRRRSVVTISAMTLALWVLVLYSGLLTGYLKDMEEDVLDFEVGDIQVFAADYLDNPSLYTYIRESEGVLANLDELGFLASPRLLAGGLAAAGELSAGVSFRGLDVERDARITKVGQRVAEGSWLDSNDHRGVVLGRRLARSLEVEPGDELIVLSQAADGSLANDLFEVRGVLLGVADGTDRTAVFMTSTAFRELLVFPRGAHQVIVRRPVDRELDEVTAAVRALAPDLTVRSWRELMPTIASMLDSTQDLIFVIFFIVYIAVGILILNAMLMAVFERIRELGILKALGMGPGSILALILLETAVQLCVALVAGLVLAIPGIFFLTHHGIAVGKLGGMSMMGLAMRPVWYGIFNANTVAGPVVMLVVMAFLAALYPAAKAAWIRPVEAIQHR